MKRKPLQSYSQRENHWITRLSEDKVIWVPFGVQNVWGLLVLWHHVVVGYLLYLNDQILSISMSVSYKLYVWMPFNRVNV